MKISSNFLFHERDLSANLRNQLGRVSQLVDVYSKDQILSTPEDTLVDHIYPEVQVEPLTLHETEKEMEQLEIKFEMGGNTVPGIRVVVTIPYSGDPPLWRLRPNQWKTMYPQAEVKQPYRGSKGYLNILIEQPADDNGHKIKQNLEKELDLIRFYIEAQTKQIEEFNSNVPIGIRDAIRARKKRLKTQDGIAEMLGIPLKQREGAPRIDPLPMKKKLVRPLPEVPKKGFKPEPGITDQNFEYILNIIRHEGRTFETTPKTYAVHDEEELRDILLAHLNGHLQGAATGETFRRSGKTDIRIEDQDRAAFVVECKIWRGPKELLDAVDQLLSYLTWRDCKAAIVLFNKHNAKFNELLKKIPETLQTHPNFKRDLGQKGDGEWRFVFTSMEDELRQITVNVFLFNLYVSG